MPWGRVDDHHYRHPKVNELDEGLRKGCLALYWLAISWCNDHLTDGRVPAGIVRTLGGDTAEALELVHVGLWEMDGSGYRVHDFLDFNKSKAEVEQEKVQRAAAGRSGARARWHSDSDLPNDPVSELPYEVPNEVLDEMHGGEHAPVTRNPLPVTPLKPVPDSRAGLPNIDGEAQTFLEGVTGRLIRQAGDKQLAEYDRLIGEHGLSAVIAAIQRAAKTLPANPQARQIIWPARSILEPFANTKGISADTSAEDAKRSERRERGTWARRIEAYHAGGQWDEAWGEPPAAA